MGLFDPLWHLFERTPTLQIPVLPNPTEPPLPGIRADSILNPLTLLGSQQVDKGAAARPNLGVVPLSDQELRSLYVYNGVAGRIVELLPQKATRRGGSVDGVPMAEE